MNTSPTIADLATALAKAQATLTGAKKDTANPFFKSRYADLASCWEAARAALPQHGLSVVQLTRTSERDEVVVITRLMHSSGEWIEGELALPVSKADAQGYGSALTYARRYGLCAIVGIAPEDDDGNAAAAAKPQVVGQLTGRDQCKAAYDASSPEEQDFLRSVVNDIKQAWADKGDVYGLYSKQRLDTEQEMAAWYLLPSDIRSAIKRAKDEMKPKEAE